MHESRFQEARFQESVFDCAVFKKPVFTELGRKLAWNLSHDDGNDNRYERKGRNLEPALALPSADGRTLLRRSSMRDQRGDYLEESQYQVRKIDLIGKAEQPG